MAEWDPKDVELALREAAEARRFIEGHITVAALSLSRLQETQEWMTWLQADDAELMRLRSSGSPWKPICWSLGMGRATAHRRWKASLRLIADRLNRVEIAPDRPTKNETSSIGIGSPTSRISDTETHSSGGAKADAG